MRKHTDSQKHVLSTEHQGPAELQVTHQTPSDPSDDRCVSLYRALSESACTSTNSSSLRTRTSNSEVSSTIYWGDKTKIQRT